MKSVLPFVIPIVIAAPGLANAAQDLQTRPRVCVILDEAQDTFSPEDRHAARILLARQFELTGRQVVSAGCSERYTLSHVRLGNTITVVLAGPGGQRDGQAAGMDDLPALYNQLVRALVAGSSVGSMRVVDRTNVTTHQALPKRVGIDSFGYARLGYGRMLGGGGAGSPALGFGFRAELDAFGFDVSVLNQQLPNSNRPVGAPAQATSAAPLKLTALYFTSPRANASAYFGGGLSWGVTSGSSGSSPVGYSSWSGSGLQGELTAGYELPRASDLRFFVQADASFPFFDTIGETVTYTQGRAVTTALGRRYNPSMTLSLGLGWRRHRP